ncbi:MAG: vWA domain-containing protein [Minicystis sp.]
MLILLDRTLTMHKTPGGATPTDAPDYGSSKWSQAINAIEAMTAPPLDKSIRFGLELWPKDSGGCITLAERVENTKQATNTACQEGEVSIPPALDNGAAIANLLDPKATTICSTTPTGSALQTAFDYLKSHATPGRAQYLVLVTDGADWDQSCPDPNPLPIVQSIAAAGIKTFMVGFSAESVNLPGGVGAAFLNDMACAGQTAKGFPAGCMMNGTGWVAADSAGPQLYLSASDGGGLAATLQNVGAQLCCNCQSTCDPPDVMITLDRTQTMHKTPAGNTPADPPDYQSSKWYQAITAIEGLVKPPLDNGVRFGLTLWPRDSGGCVTLAERVAGQMATNTFCEDGEVVVTPAKGAGASIAATLDPQTTKLCISTPTGKGLLTASDYLIKNATPGRPQYIVLVTDGADWDQSCPTPDPLPIVQKLAAGGIKTFVVGFSAEGANMPGGVGAAFLNSMACAGMTAKGFPAGCKLQGGGYVAEDPNGAALYVSASDGAALSTALESVAVSVCCDCPK